MRRKNPETTAKILQTLSDESISTKEIADIVGVSKSTIERHLFELIDNNHRIKIIKISKTYEYYISKEKIVKKNIQIRLKAE